MEQHTQSLYMTTSQIAIRCKCTPNKVNGYIRKYHIQPVGKILPSNKAHHPSNLYELTSFMEDYLLSNHKSGTLTVDFENKRKQDGWLTIYEIAAVWNCSYNKAYSILVKSNAPIRWEYGNPYNGRKFYKMPEHPSRDPSKVHYNNIAQDGDWLRSVASKEVRDMVLDERKWRRMVGRRVVVELKKYDQRIEGVLMQYSMCWFIVKRDNGRVETYRHSEAKVVEEAK